ncbi:MAG: hypothetical protein OHK0029_17920 [Armatimonadaceae bacterium]
MAARFQVSHTPTRQITSSPQSLWQRLFAMLQPHCPDCRGVMEYRYQMPYEYREVSPRYYQCSDCKGHYCRTVGGSWVAVPETEFRS